MNQFVIALLITLGIGGNPPSTLTPTQSIPITVQEVQKPIQPTLIQGEATAYYNGKDEMNGESGITASGYNLDNGIYFKGYRILASDKGIPLGTLVKLSLEDGSSITGIVLDRGGMITENKFDIVFRTKKGCFDFGRQSIKYKIIGKVEL